MMFGSVRQYPLVVSHCKTSLSELVLNHLDNFHYPDLYAMCGFRIVVNLIRLGGFAKPLGNLCGVQVFHSITLTRASQPETLLGAHYFLFLSPKLIILNGRYPADRGYLYPNYLELKISAR